MVHLKLFICALLLINSSEKIRVSALLNIVTDALRTGRELQIETEKNFTYTNPSDINYQLKHKNVFKNESIEMESRILLTMRNIEFAIDENDYNMSKYWSLKDKLVEVHKLPTKMDLDTEENILIIITDKFQMWKCRYQSRQQLLYNLYKTIAIDDAIGYVFLQYSYAVFKIFSDSYHLQNDNDKESINLARILWSEKDVIEKMKRLEREFLNRNLDTLRTFKSAMTYVPREVWKCDSNDIKDQTYTIMQNVFQKYIINEQDINEDRSCSKDCLAYNHTRVHGCFDVNVCSKQVCDGILWDCNDEMGSSMNICVSDNPDSRYQFVEANGKQYGQLGHCKNLIELKTWLNGIYKCSYCTCICDNMNIKGDRYFNLRPAISNTDLNYVITSVRFKKENNVIHIQIQEGKLLEEGVINRTTVNWKPIDNYTIYDLHVQSGRDYHTVSWNERSICLDELNAPDNYVLTGLRFKVVNGFMKLEIRVTPYNFMLTKLSTEYSYWVSNEADLSFRTEIKLDAHCNVKTGNLRSNQYLRFTTSDLKSDAGQSTIPYIDIQEVPSIPPVPLSGAGIFLRSTENKEYILSLKLLTYNFEPHVNDI